MAEWQMVERPGFLGKRRNRTHTLWSEKYGEEAWRLVWTIGNEIVDFRGACAWYEEAYFLFLRDNKDILEELINDARDVFDDSPSNVDSGSDYLFQETDRTHIQDIAIRRVVRRLGRGFKGEALIQIRQEKGRHRLSMLLSPGKVPFHRVDLILKPWLEGWWESGSVECFYQSNRVLQVLK